MNSKHYNKYSDSYMARLSFRKRRYEGRYDTLDFDDDPVNIPSDSEIDNSVRELDFVDNVALKKKASNISVDSSGNISLDLDDKGKKVTSRDSHVGAIGSLDYDDDVDTSKVLASIDDVYNALSSDDPEDVAFTIKRYAGDIVDADRIKNAIRTQTSKLNLGGLRYMCGDMKVSLTPEEKKLKFINASEVRSVLKRFEAIASKLDGEGKKVGLIPDAIKACNKNGTEENQEKCIDIINYLSGKFNFQINPLYFRGAVVHECYDLAKFLYKKIEKDLQSYEEINKDFFRNKIKGLLVRTKGHKLPSDIVGIMLNMAITKNLDSDTIGDLLIMATDDARLLKKIAPKINLMLSQDDTDSYRVIRAINTIKKNNTEVYDKLKKVLKLD